jgi:hypothetical protein
MKNLPHFLISFFDLYWATSKSYITALRNYSYKGFIRKARVIKNLLHFLFNICEHG